MVVLTVDDQLEMEEIVALYRAHNWSSANKPELLMAALINSHGLVTARIDGKLVGLVNAISDGYLVVYYPHMLVLPEFQGQGIGRQLMASMLKKYTGFHQQMLTADAGAVGFYNRMGFKRAGNTEPLWIYKGDDH